jgi:hypothetical protein
MRLDIPMLTEILPEVIDGLVDIFEDYEHQGGRITLKLIKDYVDDTINERFLRQLKKELITALRHRFLG